MHRFLYGKQISRIVPFTEARARLTELLDEVEGRHEHVVITRKGRPAAVFVSQEEWGTIDETLDVLRDEQMLDDLRASIKDVKADRLFGSGLAELRLTRRARDQLRALPEAVREAVVETLGLIQVEPERTGKRLVGLAWERMTGVWSARTGGYRILYTLDSGGVIVRAIRHRDSR